MAFLKKNTYSLSVLFFCFLFHTFVFAAVAIQRLAVHDGTLLYEIPEEFHSHVIPGVLVRVPYKNISVTGIITTLQEHSPYKTTKPIQEVLSKEPLLTPLQLQWAQELASYYMTPINRVLALFLPTKLWEGTWTPEPHISYTKTQKPYTSPTRATKEQQLLKYFETTQHLDEHTRRELGFSPQTLQTLITKEVLQKHIGKLRSTSPYPNQTLPLKELTSDQKKVFETIITRPATYLLHGVTGSGKTQIYLHLAQKALHEGKQVVILVPEIALTGQMISQFQQHFGEEVAVLHSHRTDRERAQEWSRIKEKEAHIVVGSRLALFAPIEKPALLVIDEEHDTSYKSDQSPRYHATTAAHLLYKHHPYTILLGSATPSIESYYRAEQGSYLLLTLMQKYYQAHA